MPLPEDTVVKLLQNQTIKIIADQTDGRVETRTPITLKNAEPGVQGDKGQKGQTGATGSGEDAGFPYVYDSATDTATDPGAGEFRLNNATLASATQIAIDDLDADTSDISAFIATWDDSTNAVKGHLTVQGITDATDFAIYQIDSLTDQTSYTQLDVTHIDSSGTWSNGDSYILIFSRAGDKGEVGVTGDKGDTGQKGQKGEVGVTGDKGDTGQKGQKGEVGEQGIQGIQGDKGDTGEKGQKGEIGVTGDKGDQGSQGIQGDKGDTGQKGEIGVTGDKGDTGQKR
jgi:hypothetical protein